jgi:hypothetical protein
MYFNDLLQNDRRDRNVLEVESANYIQLMYSMMFI